MQIDYVELPAPEFEDSKRFFSRVFGWDWTEYGPTYAAYEGGSVEVGLNGEGTPAPAHAPGAEDPIGPFVLLSCEDVEAKQAEVVAEGGEIIDVDEPNKTRPSTPTPADGGSTSWTRAATYWASTSPIRNNGAKGTESTLSHSQQG